MITIQDSTYLFFDSCGPYATHDVLSGQVVASTRGAGKWSRACAVQGSGRGHAQFREVVAVQETNNPSNATVIE